MGRKVQIVIYPSIDDKYVVEMVDANNNAAKDTETFRDWDEAAYAAQHWLTGYPEEVDQSSLIEKINGKIGELLEGEGIFVADEREQELHLGGIYKTYEQLGEDDYMEELSLSDLMWLLSNAQKEENEENRKKKLVEGQKNIEVLKGFFKL